MTSATTTVRKRYDAFAPEYDRWDAEHRSVADHRRTLLRHLRGKILEVGIGTGLDLPRYGKNADVVACDISGRMLGKSAMRLSKMGEHQVKLVKMDAQKLMFLDGTFDVVVGMFLFCSVDDPGKVAREIKRVLKPGGQLVTLGYHSERVVPVLRRAGLKIISTKEWPSGDRPIGQIIAERAPIANLPTARRPGRVEASPVVSDRKQMKTRRNKSATGAAPVMVPHPDR